MYEESLVNDGIGGRVSKETTDVSALDSAEALLSDVESLMQNHPAQKDPSRGRPPGAGYGPLLRACVALCYTAWEVYVEEALNETVASLCNDRDPGALPDALRTWASQNIADGWLFAGDSWRVEIPRAVESLTLGDGNTEFGLNTASPKQVSILYRDVLGVDPLAAVRWQRRSNKSVRDEVHQLVKVRGEIVHKGATPGSLNLAGVRAWVDFVRRLCNKFDQQLAEFMTEET